MSWWVGSNWWTFISLIFWPGVNPTYKWECFAFVDSLCIITSWTWDVVEILCTCTFGISTKCFVVILMWDPKVTLIFLPLFLWVLNEGWGSFYIIFHGWWRVPTFEKFNPRSRSDTKTYRSVDESGEVICLILAHLALVHGGLELEGVHSLVHVIWYLWLTCYLISNLGIELLQPFLAESEPRVFAKWPCYVGVSQCIWW